MVSSIIPGTSDTAESSFHHLVEFAQGEKPINGVSKAKSGQDRKILEKQRESGSRLPLSTDATSAVPEGEGNRKRANRQSSFRRNTWRHCRSSYQLAVSGQPPGTSRPRAERGRLSAKRSKASVFPMDASGYTPTGPYTAPFAPKALNA